MLIFHTCFDKRKIISDLVFRNKQSISSGNISTSSVEVHELELAINRALFVFMKLR